MPAQQALCGYGNHQRTRTRSMPPNHPHIHTSTIQSSAFISTGQPGATAPAGRRSSNQQPATSNFQPAASAVCQRTPPTANAARVGARLPPPAPSTTNNYPKYIYLPDNCKNYFRLFHGLWGPALGGLNPPAARRDGGAARPARRFSAPLVVVRSRPSVLIKKHPAAKLQSNPNPTPPVNRSLITPKPFESRWPGLILQLSIPCL
jgi:hypothetical protein